VIIGLQKYQKGVNFKMTYCKECNRVNSDWGYIALLGYSIVMMCLGWIFFDLLHINNVFIIIIYALIGMIFWGIWVIIYNWIKRSSQIKIELGEIR